MRQRSSLLPRGALRLGWRLPAQLALLLPSVALSSPACFAGNYVVDAPVYPHARRLHERMQDLEGRLQTHPAYDYRGTEERLPTVDQQTFELSRLIVSSYRSFLGLRSVT